MSSTMEHCSWLPSYSDLPMEIILYIFRFLGQSDLQSAGATCRRWREALCDSELNNNTIVHFAKVTLSDQHNPVLSYICSERPIHNILLEEVTFGQVRAFLDKLSNMAHDISFDNVDLSEKQFWVLMRQLKHLKALTLTKCSQLFMFGSYTCENYTDNSNALVNVRKLALRNNQYITDALLNRLTSPMHRLESLDLSGCHIAYHNAIQRRFYPNNTAVNPSESILTFMFILQLLKQHQAHLRDINFSNTLIGSSSIKALCDMEEGYLELESLRLSSCRQLSSNINSFLKTQPKLLIIDLSYTHCVDDECIKTIIKSNELLEEINIAGCLSVTPDGIILLKELKYLKRLNISRCINITTDGIKNGIAAQKNNTLRELNMSYLNVCVDCIKSVAQNLNELRILNIGHCVNGVTDESVQVIIEYIPTLRELCLEGCFLITDAALTGINIAKLGLHTAAVNSNRTSDFGSTGVFDSLSTAPDHQNFVPSTLRISLRSKAEEEIVKDANRKKAMMKAYELSLVDAHDIEGFSIERLRGLRVLNLKDCNKITDVSLKYGLKFKELRTLSLSRCQQISFVGMESLLLNTPSIEELDLTDCYNINDKTIQALTDKLKRLRTLHISGCTQLTDHSLDAIIVNCKNLQTLSIYRCRSINTDIEDRLAGLSLRNLNIEHATNMENAEIFRQKKRFDF